MSEKTRRKINDAFGRGLIYLSTGITLLVLLVIVGFILYKGVPGIHQGFLVRQWDDKTTFVMVHVNRDTNANKDINGGLQDTYIKSLGISVEQKDKRFVISHIDKNSPVKEAKNLKSAPYGLKERDIITNAGDTKLDDLTLEEGIKALNSIEGEVRLKVRRPGGGILPMLVSTLYMIVLSLLVAAPIGISSAIYLNEYAKPGRILRLIRFAIQNLAGIPSIIYGLFGMLVFVRLLKMEYSILAGSLTLSILLLPTIISTTEEALKEIPKTYRESSYGLGATKIQTISKVILPGALPGILVAVILSIGRIVGESAALIWTAGTIAQIPMALVGNKASGATLTTKMYWLIKETGDLEAASSIAVILLVLIIILNIISKQITRVFLRKRGTN